MNVKHRHPHRHTGHIGFIRGRRTPIHQRHVRGRSAHIKSDNAIKAAASRHRRRAHNSAGRPGKHRAHRLGRGRLQRRDAAAGLHHKNACAPGALSRPLPQVPEIALHYRLEIGIHQHGAGALIFAKLRQHLVRYRERQPQPGQRFRHPALILRVGKRE